MELPEPSDLVDEVVEAAEIFHEQMAFEADAFAGWGAESNPFAGIPEACRSEGWPEEAVDLVERARQSAEVILKQEPEEFDCMSGFKLMEALRPVRRTPEYLYHGTCLERFARIASEGLRVGTPSNWRDYDPGMADWCETTLCFSDSWRVAWMFAHMGRGAVSGDKDQPRIVLRARRDGLDAVQAANHDFGTAVEVRHDVLPDRLEGFAENGDWKPLDELAADLGLKANVTP